MQVTAKRLKNKKIELRINNEVMRTVDPQHMGIYKFTYDGDECHFLYEEHSVRGNTSIIISLYPVNMFQPNNIIVL